MHGCSWRSGDVSFSDRMGAGGCDRYSWLGGGVLHGAFIKVMGTLELVSVMVAPSHGGVGECHCYRILLILLI